MGETTYPSLAQAFAVAPDADGWLRVKLLGDQDYFSPALFGTRFEIPENSKVELDLNGHYLRLNASGNLSASAGSQLVITNSSTDPTAICGVFSDNIPLSSGWGVGTISVKAGLYHESIGDMVAEGYQLGEVIMPFTYYDGTYGQQTVHPNQIKTELQSYYLVTPVGAKLGLSADGKLTGAFAGEQVLAESVAVTNPVIGTTKERTEIAVARSGSDSAYNTVLPAAVRKTFAAYAPSLRIDHAFGTDFVSLVLPSEALVTAQAAAGTADLSLTVQKSACTENLALSAWQIGMPNVPADADVKLEFSAENGQEYRLYAVNDDGSIGEEITSAAAYENKARFTATATQLSRFALVKGCLHPNMKHSAEVASGCMENGTLEYWYCPDCGGYYQDAEGTRLFEDAYGPGDLKKAAPGHKDDNNDGVCDACHKAMPSFVQVTKQEEIKSGETYLMVIRDGGQLYGLHTITPEQVMEYIYPDTKLPATAALKAEVDGSIKYKTMKEAGGMLITAKAPYDTHGYPVTGTGLCLWAEPCGIWRAFDITDSDAKPLRFGFAPNDKYNVYDVKSNADGTATVTGFVSQGGTIVGAKDGSGHYFFHIADGSGSLIPYGYGSKGDGKGSAPALTKSGELLLYKMVGEESTKPQPQTSEYAVTVRGGTAQTPGYVDSGWIKAKAGDTVTLKADIPAGKSFDKWEVAAYNEHGEPIPVTLTYTPSANSPEATFVMMEQELEIHAIFKDGAPAPHVHTLTKVESQAATCTEDGNAAYWTCTCGKLFADGEGLQEITAIPVIEKLGHSFTGEYQQNADSHWQLCSRCGTAGDQIPHTYGEWVVDKAPTAAQSGTRHHDCTVCGHRIKDMIPPTGISGGGGSGGGSKPIQKAEVEIVKKPDSGKIEAKIPAGLGAKEPVKLPMEPVNAEKPHEIQIRTNSASSVRVEIPAENMKPGLVPVIVRADGTEEIVRKASATENGVVLDVKNGETVKLVDNTKNFTDTDDHWAANAIEFAASHELFGGVGNNKFAPNEFMTRGMLAQVFHNLEGNPEGSKAGFDDVDDDAWYADAIGWAAEEDIVTGTGSSFAPEASVTREQLAVMLWRYAGSPAPEGGKLAFLDETQISDWAETALHWAVENGIMGGMGNNLLAPQGTATRAQVATMLMRFVNV